MARAEGREDLRGLSPLIELQGVYKQYPNEKRLALADINLAVYPGEFVTILGPSGAGKTTLLHMLGLLDRPSAGQVLAMGVSANRLREEERAELRNGFLGFIFQFHFLLPDLTVWENIWLPLLITKQRGSMASLLGTDSDGDRSIQAGLKTRPKSQSNYRVKRDLFTDRVEQMLAAVGLQEKADSLPEELSGGEKQRVAVARALVTDPALVLADEPTGNLDTANARIVWDLLAKTNSKRGTAIVAITHNEELAKRAQRILHIVDGKLVSEEHLPTQSFQCDG